MKTKKIVLALIASGLIGGLGYGAYRIGMSRGMQMPPSVATDSLPSSASSQTGKTDPATGRKILYWQDPMVPGQKFDKPGKSPFMDMQLVPVYADGDGDGSSVQVSSRIQQNLGVRTAEVTKGTLVPAIEVVGSVAYNERDVGVVQARANGFVEKLYVRAPLDPVKKGQALAELYVPEWVAAQEEFFTVKRMGALAPDGLLAGAHQRMRLVGMTDDQIRRIESVGKVQPRLTVTAPNAGVVAELGAREGMTVMAGALLFRINGLGTIWVNAEVPESFVAQVRPGNPVEVRTLGVPGAVLKGRVNAILPEISAATRTLKVRVELANPDGQLVPGMFATINFAPSRAGKEMLLVPSEAIIQTGTRSVIMVAQAEGKFLPVDVETGLESNGQTEIRKGLEVGQKVVISGQFLIDSEASLKGTATRMSGSSATDSGKANGATHRGEGKVEAIGKDEITLSHGPIPSLQWGAMTMGFKLPAGGLPKHISVGDTVTFEIRPAQDGAFQITNISPTVGTSPTDAKSAVGGTKEMRK